MQGTRHPHYRDAYGDYRGGYGPGGGFGPPRGFGPGRGFGPRHPMMRPPPSGPPLMMPRMPPPRWGGHRSQFSWGRGFAPVGPSRKNFVDDRAIKYLLRCGMTKESVKNLPHALLVMIDPDHCGLCDFDFDSFAVSRIHYISKNHLKNQKKWLSMTQGAFPPNEIPFKSRDLYCELCDIQITSKAHGDAHYVGKPHIAIVEGRKKPKNPVLIQADMWHRLEILIRREKKFLKLAKDATDTEEHPAKNPKVVSSDLYCEICKTMVTCSEQMTTHMNGKRHLNKEKHHILSMMKSAQSKGEVAADAEAEAEVINVVADEDNDEIKQEVMDEDAKPEGETKDDGWGNEAWDIQEQTE